MKDNLTEQQKKYRETLRKKKGTANLPPLDEVVVQPSTPTSDLVHRKLPYLKHCLYWLFRYWMGEVDESRLRETLHAMRTHIDEMEAALNNSDPV